MTAPCKDCQDRCEKCHKTCSEYYVFKQERKLIAIKKEKERVSTPELSKTTQRYIAKQKRWK